MDKNWVKGLKNKYPNEWQSVYRKIAKDNSVYEMVVLSLCGDAVTKPIAKIKLTNSDDKNLYNQLIR